MIKLAENAQDDPGHRKVGSEIKHVSPGPLQAVLLVEEYDDSGLSVLGRKVLLVVLQSAE